MGISRTFDQSLASHAIGGTAYPAVPFLASVDAIRLVAVVVTYNRLGALKQTLARVLDCPAGAVAHVVVVDNASTDGTGDWLAQQDDGRLDVLHLRKNIGGTGGFAQGMRRAITAHDADWLVVMDDDSRPYAGAIADFHAMDRQGWDALSAAVYLPDGQIAEMNRPSRNPFWRWSDFWATVRCGRAGFHLRDVDYKAGQVASVDVTSFVGFFISRRAVMRIGYPDASLFIYGDDAIYALQLRANGGRIGFMPDVRFEHALSTFDGSDGRFRPLWKMYYYHRNLLILYQQAAGWMFWLVLLVILPKWGLRIWAQKGARRRAAFLMGRAVRDGILGRTDVGHDQVKFWADPIAVFEKPFV